MTDRAILDARGLSKRFGSLVALHAADVSLRAGKVTAIVGENGAGKSTLAKILAGLYGADTGTIRIDGQPVAPANRRQAAALGIGFVPQALSFVGTLSLVDNHRLSGTGLALRRAACRQSLTRTAAEIGVAIDPDRPVERLSLAGRQLAEIVSAVAHGARMLLLDEPTSALGPLEVDSLVATLKRLCAVGTAIGLVTHRVREVLDGADDVIVLRQGAVVFSGPVAGLDGSAVARLMVGTRAGGQRERPVRQPGSAARLVVRDLGIGDTAHPILENVSFEVGAGEVVGVAGVAGAAQPALAEALAGLRRDTSGRVEIDGRDITGDAAAARRAGLAYSPEDRSLGLLAEAPVSVNASLLHLGQHAFKRFGLRSLRAERHLADAIVARFDVRPATTSLPVDRLSGGNQQKLLVGRELERDPGIIIAHGPTQGLDLAAAAAIRAALVTAANAGAAILLLSADLDELLAMSSRIIVLAGRRMTAEFDGTDDAEAIPALAHRIGLAMAGAPILPLDRAVEAQG